MIKSIIEINCCLFGTDLLQGCKLYGVKTVSKEVKLIKNNSKKSEVKGFRGL